MGSFVLADLLGNIILIMEEQISIFFVLLIFLGGFSLFFWLIGESNKDSVKIKKAILSDSKDNTNITKKITYAFHGLRCYSRGLNFSESMVVDKLSILNTKEYYIFNNLILETELGSSQVDHVVVSPYGIFVIETKDYSGWIFGDENSKVWTQTLPRIHRQTLQNKAYKNTFQNPIRQNYSHIKALQEHLPFIDNSCFKTVIAFTRVSEFKTKMPEKVKYIDEIVDYIKTFNEKIVTKSAYFIAIGKLSQLCQSTDISPEKHIENIRKKYSEDDKFLFN